MVSANSSLIQILRRFLLMLGGNVGYAISQWLLLSTIAKLGNSTDVGVFSMALASTAPIYMLTNMQLRYVYSVDFSGRPFNEYLTTRLVQTFVGFVTIFFIALLYRDNMTLFYTILLISTAKATETISDVLYGFHQHHKQIGQVSFSLLLRGWAGLIILALSFYISNNFLFSLGLYTITWILCLFFDWKSFLNCAQTLKINFDWNIIKEIIKISYPLGIFSFITSLNTTVPRYFVEFFFGLSLLGIFSAISYIKVAAIHVMDALGNVLLPEMGELLKKGAIDQFFTLVWRLIAVFIIIGFSMIIISYIWGRPILHLLYTYEYAQYNLFFVLVVISIGFSYINRIFNLALISLQYFKTQLALGIFEFAVLNAALLTLLPRYGFIATAYALIIAELSRLSICLYFFSQNKLRVKLKRIYEVTHSTQPLVDL